MHRLLLAGAIYFALDAYAWATAIITIWSPETVVIGADSRHLETWPNRVPIEVCKISSVGDAVITDAGVLSVQSRLDIDQMIRSDFNTGEPIERRIEHMEKDTFGVIKVLNDARLGRIPTNASPIAANNLGIAVYVAYIVDKQILADLYVAQVNSVSNELVEIKIHCPSAVCAPGKVLPLGFRGRNIVYR